MATIYYSDPLLDEVASQIPKEVSRRTDLMMDIPYRINEILCRKGWSQVDLAKAMGKKEAEISKWLSGAHNFTIATIAKIEAALGEDIIAVKKYRKPVAGYDSLPEGRRRWLSERKESYGRKKQ
jgi:transcriptional regulator with XRE-family HTH domain